MPATKRQLSLTDFGKKKSRKNEGEHAERGEEEGTSSNTSISICELPGKVATREAAAAIDANLPLEKLLIATKEMRPVPPRECVVYWMRMEDMRIEDNRALTLASQYAQKHSIPLIVLFIISSGDYESHDRSPRRIDFMLRNLRILKTNLEDMNIPLYVTSHQPRKQIPNRVISLLHEWKGGHLFANIEYEVDELRRDIAVTALSGDGIGIEAKFVPDKLIVEPLSFSTNSGTQYAVYSPWLKKWTEKVRSKPGLVEESEALKPNDPSIRKKREFAALFDSEVPELVPGFECHDQEKMKELWPAGIHAARAIFDRFLRTEARESQVGDSSPLADGANESSKGTRIQMYGGDRARCDIDSSSRMSPYLASGVISAREIVRRTMEFDSQDKGIDPDRNKGPGSFLSEVAWRDFYTHVLAAFPRVSMGRPFNEKFSNVVWETDGNHFEKWCRGQTGVPIVDAAMRQGATQGWMHNRARMIAAMYLSKDLMIDWRLGEKHFMRTFIDGDLASNNGGWQWSASTGTDPQPYFRVFNPYTQSEKADPTGNYIRHFVPELKHLKGKALYNPYQNLDKNTFKKLGYPAPLVEHAEARKRAVQRYANPGQK
ncbi:FAD binding domain of DNA photolyase-domain-containing protein [Cantharellus anzutake]|uniref:FAD binding domain of DNA photolyase-domain-containing protein n=1 Tax=Cantharellus anzutake TaxID=1750568 RepID=UPI001908704A|nr:FAD binding domain of DNA photolyase-domain-containing protein [Cantharellus anzutake]KAF8339023.1 FAD binding domain of DNA photolyase-domain-containing protein [Cantharellus anzutake]